MYVTWVGVVFGTISGSSIEGCFVLYVLNNMSHNFSIGFYYLLWWFNSFIKKELFVQQFLFPWTNYLNLTLGKEATVANILSFAVHNKKKLLLTGFSEGQAKWDTIAHRRKSLKL